MAMRNCILGRGAWILLVSLVLGVLCVRAEEVADLKLEAVLVWGANDDKSPDPNHKPVDPEIARKLSGLPFKWTHYFEVCRKSLTVTSGSPAKTKMSKDCVIEVRRLDKGQIEVTLIGKGQPVGKITQKLRKGETLVTGGNAANFTGWFIVIKKVE